MTHFRTTFALALLLPLTSSAAVTFSGAAQRLDPATARLPCLEMYGDLVKALNAVTSDAVTVEAASTVANGRAAFSANATVSSKTSGTLKVLASAIPADTTKATHNKEYGVFVSTAHELTHALHNALSQPGARELAHAAAPNLKIGEAGWPAIALKGVSATNALDTETYAFAVQTAFTRVLVEGCGLSAGAAGHDQLADTYYKGAPPSDYVSTVGFKLAAFKTGGYLRATIDAYSRLYGANTGTWLTSGGEEIAKAATLHTALFDYYKDHSTRPTEPTVPDAPLPETWSAEQWAPAQTCVHALRVASKLYAPLPPEVEGPVTTALDLFSPIKDKRPDQREKAVKDFRAAAARALRVNLGAASRLTEACEK